MANEVKIQDSIGRYPWFNVLCIYSIHQADEAKAKAEADKVTAIKTECQADLAEAMPAFNAALKVGVDRGKGAGGGCI